MKYQYRISTDSNWTQGYGFAFLAMVNASGSGRKLTLRSLEVYEHECTGAGAVPARFVTCSSILGGVDMAACATRCDSSYDPTTMVTVRRNSLPAAMTATLNRVNLARQGGAVGNQNRILFGSQMSVGARKLRGVYKSQNGDTEPITVYSDSAVALVAEANVATTPNPRRVDVVLSVGGHTVTYGFTANCYPGEAIFSVERTGADAVKLLSYSVMDVGTTDTPTLRVVPVGALYAGDAPDTSKQVVSVMKMDSGYPNLTFAKFYTDIPIFPFGVPEIAISPASTGTPAGMNYLHTRDFWGPMYRNFLVEGAHKTAGIPDNFGCSYGHKRADLFGRRAGITINPGEGVAIVNSAETAVGVQAAYGGWPALTFAAQVDSEPQYSPQLTLTGLKSGTEVRVMNAGTNTELAGIEQVSGSWSWSYDPDTVTSVDINIVALNYEILRLQGLALDVSGLTIPIQQRVDRNYSNP